MQNIFEQGAYDTLGNYGKIPSFEDHRLWWILRFMTRRWQEGLLFSPQNLDSTHNFIY